MISSSLGAAHVTAAVAALALGFVVLVARKGTDFHRLFGAGFVVAMIVLNATALGVYQLTGQFNAFHGLVLVSLATTLWGWLLVLRRRGNWMEAHLRVMSGSYLGLLAAATAEGVVRIGPLRSVVNGPTSIIAVGVLIAVLFSVVGTLVIPRMRRSAMAEGVDH
jgi:uncharacterized membrane protein